MIRFLKTQVLRDQVRYVDLVEIQGELETHLMVKTDEPNVFTLRNSLVGDYFDYMIKFFDKEKDDALAEQEQTEEGSSKDRLN